MARHYSIRRLEEDVQGDEELNSYRNQAARLEAIVDSQPDCVKIVSADYKLKEMNLVGLEMIDAMTIDDVRGASVFELIDPEYHDVFKESVDAAYRGESSDVEFTITGLKGSKRRMSQHSAPIFNTDKPTEVIEMVAVTRDITDQHQGMIALEEAKMLAEEANKVKSNFLATMSHEFRTPLNAILGFSEIIKTESLGPLKNLKYAEYIDDIHSSGKHLLDLINDVLDISEIEAKKRVLLKQETDLEEVALHCLSTINILAEKKEVMISVNIGANMPYIYADRRSIKQILINLLSNAIKFSHEGGLISLSIHEVVGAVKVSIKDRGIGISETNLSEITEPFYREQNDAEIAVSGTGLGLSIVKSLVEAHDATLSIESIEHIGTTVSLEFPVYSE